MNVSHALLLFIAAFIAGTLNSVAGGGSFIAFPTLMFTGVPPINANATNTVALWPGTLASATAYRSELRGQRRLLLIMAGPSLVGGLLGALLLLRTPEPVFLRLLPYLLLLATLLFAFGGQLTGRLRSRLGKVSGPAWIPVAGAALVQLVIATYGGFFGGGIGILMLATLATLGMEDVHAMNGVKTVLASLINGVAVITFIIAGAIYWPQAAIMIVGAVLGGYGGASTARRIDPLLVRRFVIAVGFALTAYFFVRYRP
jgi:hypothetical protein